MKTLFVILILAFLFSCKKENKAPTANAGSDQSIVEGASVTLDASASSDPDGDLLTYRWIAPSGIDLSSATDAQPTFTAPQLSADVSYPFILVVNDGETDSPADTVVIKNANVNKYLSFITVGKTEGIGIKYVDFEPAAELAYIGTSINDAILNLDLNKDSIDDFRLIYSYRHFETYRQIIPLQNNAVGVSNTGWAKSLAFGDTIDSHNKWSNSVAYLYQYILACQTLDLGQQVCLEHTYGDWKDNDNYLAVKIIKDGKELFGWIDVKKHGFAVRGFGITVPY